VHRASRRTALRRRCARCSSFWTAGGACGGLDVVPPDAAKEGSGYAGVCGGSQDLPFVSVADVVVWSPERLRLFDARLRVV
jgi:hypothetical protein